jgi:hypothetical protein
MANKRPERLQVMLDIDELRAVDDWRFQKRMPSRAAAVRELLRRGLAAEGFGIAAEGAKSSSFGVVSETKREHPRPRSGAPQARSRSGNGHQAD